MENLGQELGAFLIAFARIGAVLMVLPAFSEESIPPRIRLLAALGITLSLTGLLKPLLPHPPSDGALAALVIGELVIGLALGMIVRIMFFAVTIAGSLMSLQTGLTSAIVADQSLGGPVPVLAKLVSIAAVVVCMALSVHHLWIAAIVKSYAAFPVGGLPAAQDFAALAVATLTKSMTLGIGLAAPLIIYGIVFNVALGLSTRLAPTIQVFFIAQPLNLTLGLALVTIIMGSVLTLFAERMAAFMQDGWML